MRTAFDTTLLWGAFRKPGSVNFQLLELGAQGPPLLDGFATDASSPISMEGDAAARRRWRSSWRSRRPLLRLLARARLLPTSERAEARVGDVDAGHLVRRSGDGVPHRRRVVEQTALGLSIAGNVADGPCASRDVG